MGLAPALHRAHLWLGSLPRPETRLLFCRITQLGLLRLLTNTKVMGESVLTIGQAFVAFDRWIEDPRVEFAPEPRGLESSFRRVAAGVANRSATKALMDIFLASFAAAEQAALVTLDSALAKLAHRRNVSHALVARPPRALIGT